MLRRIRDGWAAVALIAVLLCALYTGISGRAAPGWAIVWQRDLATVASVAPEGRAARLGIHAGDVVVTVDRGRPGSAFPSADDVDDLTQGRFLQASVMTAENALATRATGTVHDYVGTLSLDVSSRVRSALLLALSTVAAGIALLWWIARRQPDRRPIRRLALPLGVATAAPLLLVLGWQLGPPALMAAASWLGVFAAVPLAIGLIEPAEPRWLRRGTVAFVVVATLVGCAGGLVVVGGQALPLAVTGIAIGAMTAMPGLVAAVSRRLEPGDPAANIGSLELGVIGVTPLVAWLAVSASPDVSVNVWPLVAWTVLMFVGSRLAIRPLVGAVVRSRAQRDAIVAAMEVERSRLAADIHDDALQDLAMIVQRLDTSGDATSAAVVRGVADRLRAICYDLRLPILDDLGAGPALEWLVDRIERASESDVRLERLDEGRPPPAVELAVFRVAQEALANAVQHGSLPIVVRYESSRAGVRLSVEDSGPGIDAGVRDPIQAAAHFGMAAMQQRAEQVGAVLGVSAGSGRGTEVTLEWKA